MNSPSTQVSSLATEWNRVDDVRGSISGKTRFVFDVSVFPVDFALPLKNLILITIGYRPLLEQSVLVSESYEPFFARANVTAVSLVSSS